MFFMNINGHINACFIITVYKKIHSVIRKRYMSISFRRLQSKGIRKFTESCHVRGYPFPLYMKLNLSNSWFVQDCPVSSIFILFLFKMLHSFFFPVLWIVFIKTQSQKVKNQNLICCVLQALVGDQQFVTYVRKWTVLQGIAQAEVLSLGIVFYGNACIRLRAMFKTWGNLDCSLFAQLESHQTSLSKLPAPAHPSSRTVPPAILMTLTLQQIGAVSERVASSARCEFIKIKF